ncbi:MAG: NB-ARC domain-containing protein, partial [Cyclobacteriaceae bacterium]
NLPASETEGSKALFVIGNCFTNLPRFESLYVQRPNLESELKKILTDDRHPVITLVGRGGIGKTSVALRVMHDLCGCEVFQTILWFSARDIDLLTSGAKSVQPQVVKKDDLAREFMNLIQPSGFDSKDFNPKKFFESQLTNCTIGPLLVILDNFETVENPDEMFVWLDTFIRLPNKILITSRFREFKADYPITVGGLEREEFDSLVYRVSNRLEIADQITDQHKEEIFYETGGHPYVTKILLGEFAKEGKLGSLKRIVSTSDDLLIALFERTFATTSNGAKRVFLTLCSWRSVIPQLGLEAILKTGEVEKFNVEQAVDELFSFSFIDLIKADDDSVFIFVPLSAYLFGKKKLMVSPLKSLIEKDLKLLTLFGVGRKGTIKEGIRPRIENFFRGIANLISSSNAKIEDVEEALKYLCERNSETWLTLAALYEELGRPSDIISSYHKYLEQETDDNKKISIWRKLS